LHFGHFGVTVANTASWLILRGKNQSSHSSLELWRFYRTNANCVSPADAPIEVPLSHLPVRLLKSYGSAFFNAEISVATAAENTHCARSNQ
jgi:hypothetical protein